MHAYVHIPLYKYVFIYTQYAYIYICIYICICTYTAHGRGVPTRQHAEYQKNADDSGKKEEQPATFRNAKRDGQKGLETQRYWREIEREFGDGVDDDYPNDHLRYDLCVRVRVCVCAYVCVCVCV